MSKSQQKQRKVLKSRLFVRVRVRTRQTRKVPKLNNSEDVKYLSLLAELPQYLLDKVQQVQNAAARLVSCTRKYDQITPVLKELHWLPVKQRIIFKILLLTYKAQKALAPQYISDFLVHYKPSRALRSSDKKLLQVPHFKLKTYGDL